MLILTASTPSFSEVEGLDCGVDGFLDQLADHDLLALRVRTLLRGSEPAPTEHRAPSWGGGPAAAATDPSPSAIPPDRRFLPGE